MPSQAKSVILIPAYNEEANIGKTIDLIKATRIRTSIIVVNDGSSDKTSKIAKRKGCIVINLPENMGKAKAFAVGLNSIAKNKGLFKNMNALITIDADMLAVPKDGLVKILKRAENATASNKIKMVVATTTELERGSMEWFWSGIRAYSKPAVSKLVTSKVLNIPHGFGMERLLNEFFKNTTDVMGKTGFLQKKPYRLGKARQAKDFSITNDRMERRKTKIARRRPRR